MVLKENKNIYLIKNLKIAISFFVKKKIVHTTITIALKTKNKIIYYVFTLLLKGKINRRQKFFDQCVS